jgi:5-methylcytosine-specific restriction endonuclease McrBC regulatory subunit McrC
MIRLYDNRFGKHGQEFQLKNGKYNDCTADARDVWKLLDEFNGLSVEKLQTESGGNLVVFAREDSKLAELPFYTLAEIKQSSSDSRTPEQFRLDTGNLMGVLSLRKGDAALKIQVRSRFDTGEKQYFLNYLLSRVFEVNFAELVSSSDDALWDMLLAFVFLWRFSEAAAVGLYKQYHLFEYNDLNFRGRLDLDRHFKRNYPLCERIAYARRENTFDNPVNHLLRHAAAKIEKKWPSMLLSNQNAHEQLLLLKQNTPSWNASDIQSSLSHKDTLSELRHPYFAEYYEPLRKVARMLLTDEGANVFETPENRDDIEISGVLFDGSWLWEEYLATVLCARDFPDGPFIHADSNNSKTAIYSFRKTGSANYIGPLYPDFRRPLPQEQCCDTILDAKYKRGDSVQSKDKHQILCYMFLTGAKSGGLIFPPPAKSDPVDKDENPLQEDSSETREEAESRYCLQGITICTPFGNDYLWRCFKFLPLKLENEKVFLENIEKQEKTLKCFAASPKDFTN